MRKLSKFIFAAVDAALQFVGPYNRVMTYQGIVAVGDSITNACSKDLCVSGVPSKSWVEWIALALREPLKVHAKPGASSSEILSLLPAEVPAVKLALVFIGVNNIISWRKCRRDDFEADLSAILARLTADLTAVMLPPLTLGKTWAPFPYGPRRLARIRKARNVIERVAEAHGATVIESPVFVGDQVWIDGVHPTSTGHLAMADAALAALGMPERASALKREQATLRPDYKQWRAKAAAKFFLTQPAHGIGTWFLGR